MKINITQRQIQIEIHKTDKRKQQQCHKSSDTMVNLFNYKMI